MKLHGRTPPLTGAEDRLLPDGGGEGSESPHPPRSTEGPALAAYSEFQELQRRLRSVFGAAGSELLHRRSVARVAGRHPVLSGVAPTASADDLVQTLQTEAAGQSSAVAAALRAIIAEQRALLVRLIGEDLLDAVLPGSAEPPRSTEADSESHPDE